MCFYNAGERTKWIKNERWQLIENTRKLKGDLNNVHGGATERTTPYKKPTEFWTRK